jgi:hypothetical protein
VCGCGASCRSGFAHVAVGCRSRGAPRNLSGNEWPAVAALRSFHPGFVLSGMSDAREAQEMMLLPRVVQDVEGGCCVRVSVALPLSFPGRSS